MQIEELDDDIILFTITKNFNGFSNKILEYLKLKQKDIIIFFKNFSYNKLIKDIIELDNFQNSINRVLVIVPKNENQVNFHDNLNIIKSIKEGIDYIIFEKIQREL
tara:strand:+ start:2061 stop:2378 length:318 start_codon:yes stop_codon:yes gene_type:complete